MSQNCASCTSGVLSAVRPERAGWPAASNEDGTSTAAATNPDRRLVLQRIIRSPCYLPATETLRARIGCTGATQRAPRRRPDPSPRLRGESEDPTRRQCLECVGSALRLT